MELFYLNSTEAGESEIPVSQRKEVMNETIFKYLPGV
jgi:hypothetical protein